MQLTIELKATNHHYQGNVGSLILKSVQSYPGDIFSSSGLVVVDVDPLQLKVGGAGVGAGGVNAVLIRDDLPELGSDLVTALAGLEKYFESISIIGLNQFLPYT